MIKVAIIASLACLAAPAVAADSWDVFESRCLVPLEAGHEPDVAGLTRVSARDIAKSVAYTTGPYFIYTEVDAAGRAYGCSVSMLQTDELARAKKQMAPRLAAGRYKIRQASKNMLMKSTNWRKPKLRVDLSLLLGDTFLLALELRNE